jgi:hypothetical protein
MGSIVISRTGLSGSVTVEDAKITENMRLFGRATIEGFENLPSPQAKADAIAAEIYQMVKRVARGETLKEVEAATAAIRDEALSKLWEGTMQITIREALTAFESAKILGEKDIPHGPGMALKRLLRELHHIHADYESERMKLLEKYAQLDDNGKIKFNENNQAVFANGNGSLYQEAYKGLLDTSIEVSAQLEVRGLEKVEIAANILWGLGDLLIDPDEAKLRTP